MEDRNLAQVRELVADFKLEKALELLISQAQTQSQRKQNALLVLKGKLALLEEQNLAGILDHSEVARQKAAIAHQILDIADGSSLDEELPTDPK
jgi:cytochrome c-type biogenesis protein CcmH/NrfG